MGSPVFSKSSAFSPNADRSQGGASAYQGQSAQAQYGQPAGYGQSAGYGSVPDAATLGSMYGAPSATTAQTGRLTYDDVIIKTVGLLAIVIAFAAITWFTVPELFFVGAIVGLVLGLVNAFKREPSPVLIVAYAIAEGVFVGGLSAYFEAAWDGIVLQAVVATFATFTACLFLFRSGRVRVTPRFTRWLLFSMVGYMAFSLINLVVILAGGAEGWGLRSGWFGIAIGLVAVGLASASLIVDFDSIQRGVRNGVPAKFAWTAAFGLVVTLIWLYIEFLRILAIFQSD
ncbi:Bax inhibitor-1/YccA family protein [Sanguibacter antarcticus]|uniref:Putative YccA/Bax inhibitor family protein n=1 Tax=Sanguibacter antarcticus TaxID=372484 RepID=A0A2A9E0T5_9MICO|nr:Bax inhibitor-1/YccA family protein [Sanguibacter antarcticus]PFG32453.1 putative YccA/Bax inhibitor family protein [Sanguibacter antarcticus]